jgi:hypothetical protein
MGGVVPMPDEILDAIEREAALLSDSLPARIMEN